MEQYIINLLELIPIGSNIYGPCMWLIVFFMLVYTYKWSVLCFGLGMINTLDL